MSEVMTITDLVALLERRGHEQYDGEPVTQLQHALQSAHLAEQAGASSALISACLLHDIGHLISDFGPTPTLQGLDDLHQYRCLPFLRPLFDDAVLAPIKLHVDAKRYLCQAEPGYYEALSIDSQRSLVLQGGVFDAEQAAQFISQPYAHDAVALRRWDDTAKSASAITPGLAHFVQHLAAAGKLTPASQLARATAL